MGGTRGRCALGVDELAADGDLEGTRTGLAVLRGGDGSLVNLAMIRVVLVRRARCGQRASVAALRLRQAFDFELARGVGILGIVADRPGVPRIPCLPGPLGKKNTFRFITVD